MSFSSSCRQHDMPEGTISPSYGNKSADVPVWGDISQRLTTANLYWMITVRRDGRPHAVPLVGVWRDDTFFFCTGEQEQKMRNIQTNASVVVTAGPLGAEGWSRGKDIAVEGRAERVLDDTELISLAGAWFDKYGDDWRFVARNGQFFELSGSGGGRGDGDGDGAMVFRVAPSKAIVFGDDHGQTTYRLEGR